MRFPDTLKIAVLAAVCITIIASCAGQNINSDLKQAHQPQSMPGKAMDFYQGPLNHLSAVRRGSCPMHPSCSEYGRQAMAKHGFLKGWVMTLDRLMRCGRDELKTAPRIFIHGVWKAYDPLENNEMQQAAVLP